jgi:diacylglycerol kinase family enzyme
MTHSFSAPSRVAALVNAKSGSAGAGALNAITNAVTEAGHTLILAEETDGDPRPALKRIADGKPDGVVVLGGDGTQAASFGMLDCPVLPLPGGTLNWLPRALLGEGEWPDTLKACLQAPKIIPLSAGRVLQNAHGKAGPMTGSRGEYHSFFLVAQFGGPTLFAKSREAMRYGVYQRAWIAARKAWSRAFDYKLHCSELSDGQSMAYSAIVSNTSLASNQPITPNDLEIAGFEVDSPLVGAAVGVQAILDDWRSSQYVTLTSRPSFHVRSDRKIPALLDGEPIWLRPPLRVEVDKNFARVWAYA